MKAASLLDARGGRLYAFSIACLCLAQVWIGWNIAGQTNHSADNFDQGAYILMSQKMQTDWYPWYSDGTRNPALPWLAGRFLNASSPNFLQHAKRFNVLLGALGTVVIGWFFGRTMGPLPAWNASALAALAVLLPSSTFFGAETAFFVVFLLLFACATRLLNDNPLRLYAVFGLLAAVAYLIKPSATPFLALFFGFSAVRVVLIRFRLPEAWTAPQWRNRNLFVGTALFLVLYGGLISPRLIHAQATWGSPFYSLPSFWFWADDWAACVEKYKDCRKQIIDRMAPEDRPTLQGYFLRNSATDAVVRLTSGATTRLKQFFAPEKKWRFPAEKQGAPRTAVLPNRGFYIVGLGLLALAMFFLAWKSGSLSRAGPFAMPALLFITTFVLYTGATGWYLPTGPGHRFILTLYLPTLWVLSQGAEQLRTAAGLRSANRIFLTTHVALALIFGLRLVLLLTGPAFEKVAYTF